MTTRYDTTYEMGFDGDLGGIVSIDAHGHLDPTDADIFLADVVAQELYEGSYDECPTFGIEIEHLWRTEHPLDSDDYDPELDGERWTYSYTPHERAGAVAVTRFQIAHPWARPAVSPDGPRAERDRRTNEFTEDGVDHFPLVCVHHPEEPAIVGVPESRFANPTRAIDGQVHYCSPCYAAFTERLRVATEKAVAPERARTFLKKSDDDTEVIARAFGFPLLRDHLAAVLDGLDDDGSARRGITAFADAYRAAADATTPVAVATPGWHVLMLSDVLHLVEDYLPRA